MSYRASELTERVQAAVDARSAADPVAVAVASAEVEERFACLREAVEAESLPMLGEVLGDPKPAKKADSADPGGTESMKLPRAWIGAVYVDGERGHDAPAAEPYVFQRSSGGTMVHTEWVRAGRQPRYIHERPMVAIGIGAVAAGALGLLGAWGTERAFDDPDTAVEDRLRLGTLNNALYYGGIGALAGGTGMLGLTVYLAN